LQAAKARGVQLGNPRLSEATSRSQIARKAIADQHAANVVPMIREVQRAAANTPREIAEALNARGIPAPRGKQWHATSVENALTRMCCKKSHRSSLGSSVTVVLIPNSFAKRPSSANSFSSPDVEGRT
jgi:hypothetical protein